MSFRDFVENIFAGKNSMRGALAIAVVTFTFGYVTAITFIPIPPAAAHIVDIVLGSLIVASFGSIMNFYFGTSQGSVDKNTLIKSQISNNESNGV